MPAEKSVKEPVTESATPRGGVLSVVVLVGGGLIINWLSDLWAPATPVVIIIAIISLPLLAMSDGSRFEDSPPLAWIAKLKRDGLIELCLAALVLGFAIASISIIPIFPTVFIEAPSAGDMFGFYSNARTTNYEIGAVAVIVLMVTLAAYRAPSLGRQAAFLVCALYGMAFAYTYLRPEENIFFPTFAGGLIIAAILTGLLSALPRIFIVLKAFWGFAERAQPDTDAQTLRPDRDTAASTKSGLEPEASGQAGRNANP